jgi:amino acid transporter
VVFNWFVNLTNTSGFISWICSGIVYLRFRKALQVQGISRSDLPYHSNFQPWGSYLAIIGFTFLCLINGFDVFFFKSLGKPFDVSGFFTAYIGIPIYLLIYFGHRIYAWKDKWATPPAEVDLTTGLEQVLAEEKPPKGQTGPKYLQWLKKIWE